MDSIWKTYFSKNETFQIMKCKRKLEHQAKGAVELRRNLDLLVGIGSSRSTFIHPRPSMLVTPSQSQHNDSEYKHRQSPPQIDVDIKRAFVELAITQRSKEHQQDSTDREQHSDWQPDIKSH